MITVLLELLLLTGPKEIGRSMSTWPVSIGKEKTTCIDSIRIDGKAKGQNDNEYNLIHSTCSGLVGIVSNSISRQSKIQSNLFVQII